MNPAAVRVEDWNAIHTTNGSKISMGDADRTAKFSVVFHDLDDNGTGR
jgi:hypothetical protein